MLIISYLHVCCLPFITPMYTCEYPATSYFPIFLVFSHTSFLATCVYMAEPEVILCVVSIDEVDLFALCAYYVKEKDIILKMKKKTLHRAIAIRLESLSV